MKTYSYDDIKDSRIVYDKNPPVLMPIILLLVTLLITVLVVLSFQNNKTYVVKGQGLVQSTEKQYVMCSVSGQLTDAHFEEGQHVNAGDILGVVKSTDLNLQQQQLEGQIKLNNDRLALLNRFLTELNKGINTFDKKSSSELEFYNIIQTMYADMREYNVDDNALKSQGYTDDQINQYKNTASIKKQQIKTKTIEDATKEKSQLELDTAKLNIQLDAVKKGQEDYKITAPISGTIHLETPVASGLVVQAGNAICTITGTENLYFETYISAEDRARIQVNDPVEVAVGGLMQSEYGLLKGQITEIDSDATVNKDKGNVYFKVIVKTDKDYLTDKKGNIAKITPGMTAEVRVQYDQVSYFKYILEALGIKL